MNERLAKVREMKPMEGLREMYRLAKEVQSDWAENYDNFVDAMLEGIPEDRDGIRLLVLDAELEELDKLCNQRFPQLLKLLDDPVSFDEAGVTEEAFKAIIGLGDEQIREAAVAARAASSRDGGTVYSLLGASIDPVQYHRHPLAVRPVFGELVKGALERLADHDPLLREVFDEGIFGGFYWATYMGSISATSCISGECGFLLDERLKPVLYAEGTSEAAACELVVFLLLARAGRELLLRREGRHPDMDLLVCAELEAADAFRSLSEREKAAVALFCKKLEDTRSVPGKFLPVLSIYFRFDDSKTRTEDVASAIGGYAASLSPVMTVLAAPARLDLEAVVSLRLAGRGPPAAVFPRQADSFTPYLTLPETHPVRSLAFRYDSRRLASGNGAGTVSVWNGDSRKARIEAAKSQVTALAYNPDGRTIAAGTNDGHLCLLDPYRNRLLTGKPVFRVRIDSLEFDTPGQQVTATAVNWAKQTWQADLSALIAQSPRSRESASYTSVVRSPLEDLELLIAGADKIAHVSSREGIKPLIGHKYKVLCGCFNSDASLVATGSSDKTVMVWDRRKGYSPVATLDGFDGWVNCVRFSPDGMYIAGASDDSTVRIWEIGYRRTDGGIAYACLGASKDKADYARTPIIVDKMEKDQAETALALLKERHDDLYSSFRKDAFAGLFWARFMPAASGVSVFDGQYGVLFDEKLRELDQTKAAPLLYLLLVHATTLSGSESARGPRSNSRFEAEYAAWQAFLALTAAQRKAVSKCISQIEQGKCSSYSSVVDFYNGLEKKGRQVKEFTDFLASYPDMPPVQAPAVAKQVTPDKGQPDYLMQELKKLRVDIESHWAATSYEGDYGEYEHDKSTDKSDSKAEKEFTKEQLEDILFIINNYAEGIPVAISVANGTKVGYSEGKWVRAYLELPGKKSLFLGSISGTTDAGSIEINADDIKSDIINSAFYRFSQRFPTLSKSLNPMSVRFCWSRYVDDLVQVRRVRGVWRVEIDHELEPDERTAISTVFWAMARIAPAFCLLSEGKDIRPASEALGMFYAAQVFAGLNGEDKKYLQDTFKGSYPNKTIKRMYSLYQGISGKGKEKEMLAAITVIAGVEEKDIRELKARVESPKVKAFPLEKVKAMDVKVNIEIEGRGWYSNKDERRSWCAAAEAVFSAEQLKIIKEQANYEGMSLVPSHIQVYAYMIKDDARWGGGYDLYFHTLAIYLVFVSGGRVLLNGEDRRDKFDTGRVLGDRKGFRDLELSVSGRIENDGGVKISSLLGASVSDADLAHMPLAVAPVSRELTSELLKKTGVSGVGHSFLQDNFHSDFYWAAYAYSGVMVVEHDSHYGLFFDVDIRDRTSAFASEEIVLFLYLLAVFGAFLLTADSRNLAFDGQTVIAAELHVFRTYRAFTRDEKQTVRRIAAAVDGKRPRYLPILNDYDTFIASPSGEEELVKAIGKVYLQPAGLAFDQQKIREIADIVPGFLPTMHDILNPAVVAAVNGLFRRNNIAHTCSIEELRQAIDKLDNKLNTLTEEEAADLAALCKLRILSKAKEQAFKDLLGVQVMSVETKRDLRTLYNSNFEEEWDFTVIETAASRTAIKYLGVMRNMNCLSGDEEAAIIEKIKDTYGRHTYVPPGCLEGCDHLYYEFTTTEEQALELFRNPGFALKDGGEVSSLLGASTDRTDYGHDALATGEIGKDRRLGKAQEILSRNFAGLSLVFGDRRFQGNYKAKYMNSASELVRVGDEYGAFFDEQLWDMDLTDLSLLLYLLRVQQAYELMLEFQGVRADINTKVCAEYKTYEAYVKLVESAPGSVERLFKVCGEIEKDPRFKGRFVPVIGLYETMRKEKATGR
ncbi:MAG: WD40 repeat domain-containing protein, partial [Deltaproteobacteria bacterium]